MKRLAGFLIVVAGALGLGTLPAHAAPYALDTVSNSSFTPGGSGSTHCNGFRPGATATVRLVGSTTVTIGSLQADSDGVVDGGFNVPAGTPAGTYELQVTGPKNGGGTLTYRFTITVGDVVAAGATPISPTGTIAEAATGSGSGGTSGGGTLPVTGSDVSSLVVLGTGVGGLGLLALATVRVNRRRSVRPL